MSKIVRLLALDFPDTFPDTWPQFFLGNFSRQEGKNHTQHCIFSRGCLPVKMASKTVIRFSALLPISATLSNKRPLQMCFVNKRPHSNII